MIIRDISKDPTIRNPDISDHIKDRFLKIKRPFNVRFTRIVPDTIEVTDIRIPVIPQVVNYSYAPHFDKVQTLGRLSPIYQYTGGTGVNYSFSITVHASMVSNLEDFVDNIKSLSHPSLDSSFNISNFPIVLMELGEIISYVLVETHINWKLPVDTRGKYTLVNIDFNIKELEELPLVFLTKSSYHSTTSLGLSEDFEKNLEFKDAMIIYYKFAGIIKEQMYSNNASFESIYGANLPNINKTLVEDMRSQTITETWDGLTKRLDNLFGQYSKQLQDKYIELGKLGDSKLIKELQESISEGKKFLEEITKIKKDITKIDLTNQEDLKNTLDNLENFRKQHHAFIDEYRKKYTEYLTAGDVKIIKANVDNIVEQIKKIITEVIGYGRAT